MCTYKCIHFTIGCDPDTLGSGSGVDPQAVCGDNSVCQNNAECLCVSGYFSPTGSQSDCHGNNGIYLYVSHNYKYNVSISSL